MMVDPSQSDADVPEAADADCGESCCCCGGLLGGLIQPSDTCFTDFVSPMTNPVFFEDPRTLTEARVIFINHWLPNALGGGDVKVLAVQARAALTDRLSIVAAKDGYIFADANAPLNAVLNDGWADISVGLKYNLLADPCCGRIVSTGFAYELASGSRAALQGNGNGEFHVYLTAGQRVGCNGHVLSATGFRLPVDTNAENQVWYWSNHADYHLGCGVYAVAEANWYHFMSSGTTGGAFNGVQGGDLFNFGSTNVTNTDIVTGALGVKLKPCDTREIGVAWETHLSDTRGVLKDRLTVDYILRY
ncbi:MAG: hypothetical protein KDA41_21155 [Planctomycetales bacterium]|nr:hypothetical protein [Planctomycetales bacterium]